MDVQEIDAASNSRVEDVRELREVIRYHPQSARYRVTILDEVHMLSKAAFNALLKTLEEPPEHAVFILATTDVHKVPLTILSRCQRFDFRRLPPRVLAEHLRQVLAAEGLSLPAESLALMAREADGSVRDALSLLDQVLAADKQSMTHPEVVELLGLVDRELVTATANAVLAGQAGAVLDLVSQVYAAGGEMQAFYAALQEHFRNLAAAKAAPEGADLFGLTLEEMAALRSQAAPHSPETLHEIFDHLAASEDLFRRASQPRLVMEMTLLKLTQVKPVVSLAEIISGLERAAGEAPDPAPRPPAQPGPSPSIVSGPGCRPLGSAAPAAPSPGGFRGSGRPGPRPRPGDPLAMLKELVRYAEQSEPALASYLGAGQRRAEQRLAAGDPARRGHRRQLRHREEPAAPEPHGRRAVGGRPLGAPAGLQRDPAAPGPSGPGGGPGGGRGRAGRAPGGAPGGRGLRGRGGGFEPRRTQRPHFQFPSYGARLMIPRGGMGNLMKQAQKMQEQMLKMQQELEAREVSASSGGGMVEAVVNGKGELLRLKLDPEVVDPQDVEMLCDLLVAAVGEAQRRAQEMTQQEMSKLTGGLNIPGLT